jgi:hypothetical protein
LTRRGDWLWAIVRDYLRQYRQGTATAHEVQAFADSVYNDNPTAFRGSPDRLRVGRYLTMAGISTSCGGTSPSLSPPTTTSHPDPLVIPDCFSDQPHPDDCAPVVGPSPSSNQPPTPTATTVVHYDPSNQIHP